MNQISKKNISTADEEKVLFESTFIFLYTFFVEAFFSTFIGAVFAFGCTYILKQFRTLSKSPIGCALMFCMAAISYLIAEYNQRSGIIAILTCGMLMSNYAWYNLSPQA